MRRGVVALILCLLACAAPAQARAANVGIGDFFFRAERVRIDPGDTVTWTNRGQTPHTVTSRRGAPQAFNSGDLDPAQVFSRVFAEAGAYRYVCTIHPDQMTGLVQVGPDRVKPKVTRLSARAGKKLRLFYRLSEPSRVVVKLTRRGKTVRTVRGRRAANGSITHTLALPPEGTYTVAVTATDLEGNRSAAARRSVTVR